MEGFNEALVPLWLSIKVATLATLVVFVPGCLAGLLLSRRSFPGKAIVETLFELPLVLPPTAVGFMLLLALGKDGLFGRNTLPFDPGILFTWRAAVLASAVMAFPLVARTARVAFDNVDPRLERMAASLGFSRLAVKLRVTLPIAGRGLMAAALLGFSRALGEFGATALVAGNQEGKTRTLALAIFNDIQEGNYARARALLAIAIVLAYGAIAAVAWLQRRDRRLRGEEPS
ncbi:MAG: molybdate ABC transporter permease subunit [Planctomycetota bacterium]